MSVKFELMQVFPPVEGWVVIERSTGGDDPIYSWDPVMAMAQIKEIWYGESSEVIRESITVVPLVQNYIISGLCTPNQTEDFGIVMDEDSLDGYETMHWSKVREAVKRRRVDDLEGLLTWVESHEAPMTQAQALNGVKDALFMLGFGNVKQPGAIEGHTMKMMEKYDELASAIGGGLTEIAEALAGK